eukprot:928619-Pyramimonas_sp.AAC.1
MLCFCWIRLEFGSELAWVSLTCCGVCVPFSLQTNTIAFLNAWAEFGGHSVFKFHMCIHLAQQIAVKGNPTGYWTYPDESENRVMQKVAKSLHGGSTFYVRMIEK